MLRRIRVIIEVRFYNAWNVIHQVQRNIILRDRNVYNVILLEHVKKERKLSLLFFKYYYLFINIV